MKLKKLSLFVALVAFVASLAAVGCTTSPTTTSSSTTTTTLAANQVKIVFDLNECNDPVSFGVVPFAVGTMADYISGAGDWAEATNGGITAAGTGPQVLTMESANVYSIVLTLPDTNDYVVNVKPANYLTSQFSLMLDDDGSGNATMWEYIGAALTGTGNYDITVSNYMVIEGALSTDTNGFSISADGKTVTCDVSELGDWSVAIDGVTTAEFALTINWTDIPAVFTNANGISFYTPQTGLEITTGEFITLTDVTTNDEAGDGVDTFDPAAETLVTNTAVTNTEFTNAMPMVVTGGAEFLHQSAVTWNVAEGTPLVFSDATTASVTVTVPVGSSKKFEFKAVDSGGGWTYQESGNRFGPLLESGDQSVSVIFLQ